MLREAFATWSTVRIEHEKIGIGIGMIKRVMEISLQFCRRFIENMTC
jgi:hypothetical protein